MPLIAAVLMAVGSFSADAALTAAATTPAVNGPQSRAAGPNGDALALKEFKERLDKYVELHKRAARSAPPLKETTDPKNIKHAEESLAAAIRAERSSAQPGDIFTPAIQDNFRKLLSPALKGEDGREAK
jgi:hypothetical protein